MSHSHCLAMKALSAVLLHDNCLSQQQPLQPNPLSTATMQLAHPSSVSQQSTAQNCFLFMSCVQVQVVLPCCVALQTHSTAWWTCMPSQYRMILQSSGQQHAAWQQRTWQLALTQTRCGRCYHFPSRTQCLLGSLVAVAAGRGLKVG